MKDQHYSFRHYEFVTNIIEVKVLCKRGRGRSNKPYLEDIRHFIQISKYSCMEGAVLDRKEWLRLQLIV